MEIERVLDLYTSFDGFDPLDVDCDSVEQFKKEIMEENGGHLFFFDLRDLEGKITPENVESVEIVVFGLEPSDLRKIIKFMDDTGYSVSINTGRSGGDHCIILDIRS